MLSYGVKGFLFEVLDFFLYTLLGILLERGHLGIKALVERFKKGMPEFLAHFFKHSFIVVLSRVDEEIFSLFHDCTA